MRLLMIIAVIIQLLLRGAAVPHGHAHEEGSQSSEHACRAHIHLKSHHHPHAIGHAHPHRHGPHHSQSKQSSELEPLVPDHDKDTLYVGCDHLIAAGERVQVPSSLDAEWLVAADCVATPILCASNLITFRSLGPPGYRAGPPLESLPHMLRI